MTTSEFTGFTDKPELHEHVERLKLAKKVTFFRDDFDVNAISIVFEVYTYDVVLNMNQE